MHHNYIPRARQPPVRHVPIPVPESNTNGSSKMVIIIIVIVVASFLFLGTLAIALGLGLGLGFKKTPESSSSKSIPATLACDTSAGQQGCTVIVPTTSSAVIIANAMTTNTWPWIVALYVGNNTICSGFLLTNRHVITTATCIYGRHKTNITVYVGITSLSNTQTGQIRFVSNMTYPSTYTKNGTIDDIAVLTLNKNVTLSSTVAVCSITNDKSISQVNEHSVAVSWNEISSSSSSLDAFHQSDVEIQSPSTCGVSTSNDTQLCVNYSSVGNCRHDKDSVLMINKDNVWRCAGIGSAISDSNSTCSSGGIYTRVSYYTEFINNATTLYALD